MKPSNVLISMKALYWLAQACLFIQCSAPKLTSLSKDHFFENDRPAFTEKSSQSILKPSLRLSPATGGSSIQEPSLLPSPEVETLVASASKQIALPKKLRQLKYDSLPREKVNQTAGDEKTKNGDKRKNPQAVLGFLGIVAGLSLGITIPITVATSWPLLFVPIGMVLCAIGLKSQRKGWAKAGLIIGGLAICFGIVAAVLVSNFKLH